jgi:hypothetical protein
MNINILTFQLIRIVGLVGVVSLTNLVNTTATAFTADFYNTDFENDFNNWETTGDTSIQNTFQGINPIGGKNQALITTSCPASPFASGECFDTQNPTNYRQDDPDGGNANRIFNFSGFDQTDANGNNAPNNLQTFLGLGANSLNINRTGGTINGRRTPKEGSAITQTITVNEPFKLTFNWNYLTNDGTHPIFGNQDYSFLTIYPQDSDPSTRNINILGDSTGAIKTPILSNQSDFEKVGGYLAYDSGVLQPGTYVIGLGVVDTDGTGISSGLLVDNFAVETVPFDFSASTGLVLVGGCFCFTQLRRKLRPSLSEK